MPSHGGIDGEANKRSCMILDGLVALKKAPTIVVCVCRQACGRERNSNQNVNKAFKASGLTSGNRNVFNLVKHDWNRSRPRWKVAAAHLYHCWGRNGKGQKQMIYKGMIVLFRLLRALAAAKLHVRPPAPKKNVKKGGQSRCRALALNLARAPIFKPTANCLVPAGYAVMCVHPVGP